MIYKENPTKMDDEWGSPHLGNLHVVRPSRPPNEKIVKLIVSHLDYIQSTNKTGIEPNVMG